MPYSDENATNGRKLYYYVNLRKHTELSSHATHNELPAGRLFNEKCVLTTSSRLRNSSLRK